MNDVVRGTAPASLRFPRTVRVNDGAAFTRALRSRQRLSSPMFAIRYCPNGRGAARLGIACGRRVSRHATQRNRIKRALREAFRARLGTLASIDVVVLVQPPCGRAHRRDIAADAASLFDALPRRGR